MLRRIRTQPLARIVDLGTEKCPDFLPGYDVDEFYHARTRGDGVRIYAESGWRVVASAQHWTEDRNEPVRALYLETGATRIAERALRRTYPDAIELERAVHVLRPTKQRATELTATQRDLLLRIVCVSRRRD